MRENHYAIPCIGFLISYVHKLQDKHNASYFSKMSWKGYAIPTANIAIICETIGLSHKSHEKYLCITALSFKIALQSQ